LQTTRLRLHIRANRFFATAAFELTFMATYCPKGRSRGLRGEHINGLAVIRQLSGRRAVRNAPELPRSLTTYRVRQRESAA